MMSWGRMKLSVQQAERLRAAELQGMQNPVLIIKDDRQSDDEIHQILMGNEDRSTMEPGSVTLLNLAFYFADEPTLVRKVKDAAARCRWLLFHTGVNDCPEVFLQLMRAICSQSFDVPRVVVVAAAQDIDEASPSLCKLAEMMPTIDLTTDLDVSYYLELLERDGPYPEAIRLAEFHWRLQKLPVPWLYRSLWRLYAAKVHAQILTGRQAAEFAYLSRSEPAPAEEAQIIALMSEVFNA